MSSTGKNVRSVKNTKITSEIKKFMLLNGVRLLTNKNLVRNVLLSAVNKGIKNSIHTYEFTYGSKSEYLSNVQSQFFINLLRQGLKNVDRGYVSKEYVQSFVENLVKPPLYGEGVKETIDAYKSKHGVEPPGFVLVSPTQKCNLKCTGCYAASNPSTLASLPYNVVERLIKEMHDMCGSRFSVISGGEPFMWKDGTKDVISLAEEFKDTFFMVYTNGTLMSQENLKRLKETANMTPAISVEGYEEQTDKRRGKGIYKRILQSIEQLKKYGVPFGASVTATKENIDILMQDDFYEYWFEELGATYMWIFHLMPIGRAKDTMDLMLTPEQRLRFTLKWEDILFKKGYFVADFWDAGPGSRGCLAYGRPSGYFYIDWNGNIMPCVFVPFYKDNIYNLYKQNKTITDALMSDLFVRGRKWQSDYGYMKDSPGNFFTPCAIRDNHRVFREEILTPDAKPEDENARLALEDPEYLRKMEEFDKELQQKMTPLWEERMKVE
jgi:MoaA/NifB/PqqE/SkfB family radical SAM enzyme